jgi:hypothetical protein
MNLLGAASAEADLAFKLSQEQVQVWGDQDKLRSLSLPCRLARTEQQTPMLHRRGTKGLVVVER